MCAPLTMSRLQSLLEFGIQSSRHLALSQPGLRDIRILHQCLSSKAGTGRSLTVALLPEEDGHSRHTSAAPRLDAPWAGTDIGLSLTRPACVCKGRRLGCLPPPRVRFLIRDSCVALGGARGRAGTGGGFRRYLRAEKIPLRSRVRDEC